MIITVVLVSGNSADQNRTAVLSSELNPKFIFVVYHREVAREATRAKTTFD